MTVVVLPEGTVGSGEIRGGAPATRETAVLDPLATVEQVDAIVLSGGSAFGLAAADGVMRALAEQGRGFPTRGGPVPIVPAAAIFDLVASGGERPGPEEGRAALAAAQDPAAPPLADRSGRRRARRERRQVARRRPRHHRRARARRPHATATWSSPRIAVVNAVGDIVGDDGRMVVASTRARRRPGFPDPAPFEEGTNTTLVVVVTNARCTKVECHLLARERAPRPRPRHPPVAHPPRRRPRVRVRHRRGRRAPRPPAGAGHRGDGRGDPRLRSRTITRHPDESGPTVSLLEPPSSASFASFAELEREALACTKCPLAETRTQVVFGVGDPTADLLFVGEGPGEQEDLTGEPFVGRAGQLLTSLIEGIGLTRDAGLHRQRREVPSARQPRPAPARDRDAAARTSRRSSSSSIRRVVVTLGNFATKLLLAHQGRHHEAPRAGVPVPRRRRAHPRVAPVGGAAQRRSPRSRRPAPTSCTVKRALAARDGVRDDAAHGDAQQPTRPHALGRRVGAVLRAGDVVVLAGDLGTGKTVFAKGIARGARRHGAGREPDVHDRPRVRRAAAAGARRRVPARPPAGAARPRLRRARRRRRGHRRRVGRPRERAASRRPARRAPRRRAPTTTTGPCRSTPRASSWAARDATRCVDAVGGAG